MKMFEPFGDKMKFVFDVLPMIKLSILLFLLTKLIICNGENFGYYSPHDNDEGGNGDVDGGGKMYLYTPTNCKSTSNQFSTCKICPKFK